MRAMIAAILLLGLAMTAPEDPARQEAVDLARRTLAGALGVSEARIHLESVAPVEWPDASLGCPEKGMAYAQVVTPGYRVALRVDDRTYEVHVGGRRAVLCSGGAPTRPSQREAYARTAAGLSSLARRDLASRLKAPETEIEVAFVRPRTWPDAGLGCPERGRSDGTPPVPGFLIELRAGGKTYRYHADQTIVVFCGEKP